MKPGNKNDVLHLFNSQPQPSCKCKPEFYVLDDPPAKIPSCDGVLPLSWYWNEGHCTLLPPRAQIRNLRKIVWPERESALTRHFKLAITITLHGSLVQPLSR